MEEKVNLFITSIVGVNRDLEDWEKSENRPAKERIKEEWNYLRKLLEIAETEKIDTNLIVCEHARNCVQKFIKFAPEQALATVC